MKVLTALPRRTCSRPRGEQGFTFVELLLAGTLLIVLVLAVFLVFETSRITSAQTNAKIAIHQNARLALVIMERELRMAGTGVPGLACPGVLVRIVDARRRSITIRADLRSVSTSLTTTANIGSSALAVNTAAGISANDVIYLTNGLSCDTLTVQGVGTGTLALTTSLARSYATGSRVYRPKDVTFSLSNGQLLRDERNPGTSASGSPPVLAELIQMQDAFRYFDASNLEIVTNNPVVNPDTSIRRIRVSLGTLSASIGVGQAAFTLGSDVRPRNL